MKRFALVLFIAVCFAPFLHAQTIRYGQAPPKAKPGISYPIQVHISSIHRRPFCSLDTLQDVWCNDSLYADATLNGQKLELMGNWIWYRKFTRLIPIPGDYSARILKKSRSSVPFIGAKYELLLHENTIWDCTVTGISE